jgi:hypothetical protein
MLLQRGSDRDVIDLFMPEDGLRDARLSAHLAVSVGKPPIELKFKRCLPGLASSNRIHNAVSH